MQSSSILDQPTDRIFRPIRAALVFNSEDMQDATGTTLHNAFSRINVDLVSFDEFKTLDREFDVLGVMQCNTTGLAGSNRNQRIITAPGYIKIGFYYGENSEFVRKPSRVLDAAIICHDSLSQESAIQNTIFHFFESLTLPSLLNIDLSDVRSVARGFGRSFHYEGDSSKEIIKKLPREIFKSKSALLHFTCTRDVTLDELYTISNSVTLKPSTTNRSRPSKREIDLYRRMNLKMGMRVIGSSEAKSASDQKRISFTAILFGT